MDFNQVTHYVLNTLNVVWLLVRIILVTVASYAVVSLVLEYA